MRQCILQVARVSQGLSLVSEAALCACLGGANSLLQRCLAHLASSIYLHLTGSTAMHRSSQGASGVLDIVKLGLDPIGRTSPPHLIAGRGQTRSLANRYRLARFLYCLSREGIRFLWNSHHLPVGRPLAEEKCPDSGDWRMNLLTAHEVWSHPPCLGTLGAGPPVHLFVFTDASVLDSAAAVAAVFVQVPDEIWGLSDRLRDFAITPDNSLPLSMPLSGVTDTFMAEGCAVLTALLAAPTEYDLCIVSDCQSLIKVLSRACSSTPVSDRDRVRQSARPVVNTIARLVSQRSGATSFTWVKAHTGLQDFESVGNAMADQAANEARLPPDLVARGPPLQPGSSFDGKAAVAALEESWIILVDTTRTRHAPSRRPVWLGMEAWHEAQDAGGLVALVGDPRSQLLEFLALVRLSDWHNSVSKAVTSGHADPFAIELRNRPGYAAQVIRIGRQLRHADALHAIKYYLQMVSGSAPVGTALGRYLRAKGMSELACRFAEVCPLCSLGCAEDITHCLTCPAVWQLRERCMASWRSAPAVQSAPLCLPFQINAAQGTARPARSTLYPRLASALCEQAALLADLHVLVDDRQLNTLATRLCHKMDWPESRDELAQACKLKLIVIGLTCSYAGVRRAVDCDLCRKSAPAPDPPSDPVAWSMYAEFGIDSVVASRFAVPPRPATWYGLTPADSEFGALAVDWCSPDSRPLHGKRAMVVIRHRISEEHLFEAAASAVAQPLPTRLVLFAPDTEKCFRNMATACQRHGVKYSVLFRPPPDVDDHKHEADDLIHVDITVRATRFVGFSSHTFVVMLQNDAAAALWPYTPAQHQRVVTALQTGRLDPASAPFGTLLPEPSVAAGLSIQQLNPLLWSPVVPPFRRDSILPPLFRLPWALPEADSAVVWDAVALATFWLNPTGPAPPSGILAGMRLHWTRHPPSGPWRDGAPRASPSLAPSPGALDYLAQGAEFQRTGVALVGVVPPLALGSALNGEPLLDPDCEQLRTFGIALGRLTWVLRCRVLALRRRALTAQSCPAALRALQQRPAARSQVSAAPARARAWPSVPSDVLGIVPVPVALEAPDDQAEAALDCYFGPEGRPAPLALATRASHGGKPRGLKTKSR